MTRRRINSEELYTLPLSFVSSTASAGLEIVDIYLWTIKRILEQKEIAPKIRQLIYYQRNRGITDEVSLAAIQKRWSNWFSGLPEPTESQLERAKEIMQFQEDRRLEALR